MNASEAGNIWISRRASTPGRRPLKRSRENAYAASEARATVPKATTMLTISELTNQFQYG